MLLYYITERRAFPGPDERQRTALLQRVVDTARAGVDLIQLREKDLPACELESLAREAVAAVRENSSTTRILINGSLEVALACGADGVHLSIEGFTASDARALWMLARHVSPAIGVSAHSIADVRYAEAHGADFAVLAPIYEKPGTQAPRLGIDALRVACMGPPPPDNTEAAPRSRFPVLALGGVNLENAANCLRAGAAGVAGIRLFQEGNVGQTVQQLRLIVR